MTESSEKHIERLRRMKGNPANHNVDAIDAINAATQSIKDMCELRRLVSEFEALNEISKDKLRDSTLEGASREGIQQLLREASEAMNRRDELGQKILELIRKSG